MPLDILKHNKAKLTSDRALVLCSCIECNGKMIARSLQRRHQHKKPRRAPSDDTRAPAKLSESIIFQRLAKRIKLSPRSRKGTTPLISEQSEAAPGPSTAAEASDCHSPSTRSSPVEDCFSSLALQTHAAASPAPSCRSLSYEDAAPVQPDVHQRDRMYNVQGHELAEPPAPLARPHSTSPHTPPRTPPHHIDEPSRSHNSNTPYHRLRIHPNSLVQNPLQ